MNTTIYDYANNAVKIELSDNKIICINVVVVSGDEVISVVFEDGTVRYFDASNSRCINFCDGFYTVSGDNIQKWLNFDPTGIDTVSYKRHSMFM